MLLATSLLWQSRLPSSVEAFFVSSRRRSSPTTSTVGTGFSSLTQLYGKTKSKTNKQKQVSQAFGMGKTAVKNKSPNGTAGSNSSSNSNDTTASVARLEKKYDELLLEQAKYEQREEEESVVTTIRRTREYIVTARRRKRESSDDTNGKNDDWVPIAQLCAVRTNDDATTTAQLSQLVTMYCRELAHLAIRGSYSYFQSIPRNHYEYGIEPLDSFHKYVYGTIIDSQKEEFVNSETGSSDIMTRSKALEILQINDTSDDLKQVYRKLSFQYHPDRFVQSTEQERDNALVKYHEIKLAYETLVSLGGGSNNKGSKSSSWYESLGGRSRNEFQSIELLLNQADTTYPNDAIVDSAIAGLDPDIVQRFVLQMKKS